MKNIQIYTKEESIHNFFKKIGVIIYLLTNKHLQIKELWELEFSDHTDQRSHIIFK